MKRFRTWSRSQVAFAVLCVLAALSMVVLVLVAARRDDLNPIQWTVICLLCLILGIGVLSVRENWYVRELAKQYERERATTSWLLSMLSIVMVTLNVATFYLAALSAWRAVTGEPVPVIVTPLTSIVFIAILLLPVVIGRSLRKRRPPPK